MIRRARKKVRCKQYKTCNVIACEHHDKHKSEHRCMAAGCQFHNGNCRCVQSRNNRGGVI